MSIRFEVQYSIPSIATCTILGSLGWIIPCVVLLPATLTHFVECESGRTKWQCKPIPQAFSGKTCADLPHASQQPLRSEWYPSATRRRVNPLQGPTLSGSYFECRRETPWTNNNAQNGSACQILRACRFGPANDYQTSILYMK
ncbi:hypothetical protein BDR05DRAFT_585530 [Suillus weaverae]|nr:hypothetical protein BDR05DRAFT_585530 [Suillus weaverae]